MKFARRSAHRQFHLAWRTPSRLEVQQHQLLSIAVQADPADRQIAAHKPWSLLMQHLLRAQYGRNQQNRACCPSKKSQKGNHQPAVQSHTLLAPLQWVSFRHPVVTEVAGDVEFTFVSGISPAGSEVGPANPEFGICACSYITDEPT